MYESFMLDIGSLCHVKGDVNSDDNSLKVFLLEY